jgi:methylmalonyl-CoA/ethylmalonyl-CoA epimerase
MPEKPTLLFDHIGLVVADLAQGREHLTRTLGISQWTEPFEDTGIGVCVQFGTTENGPAIELIAPLGEQSPVAKALRTGQRTLNHLAYLTSDLVCSAAHLVEEGLVATGQAQEAVAYGGRKVQFFVSPLRFMVELIEAPGHTHAYTEPIAAAQTEAGL